MSRGSNTKSPFYVGIGIAAVSLAGLGVQMFSRSDATRAEAASSHSGQEPSVCAGEAFHSQVRDALNPGYRAAKELGTVSEDLASGAVGGAALSGLASTWQADLTKASEAVGALPLPAVKWGAEARSMYRLGAALYAQSAASVPAVLGTAPGSPERAEALKTVGRLRVLGDRYLDAGNRLLREVSCPGADSSDERISTRAVPDFRDEGLEAGSGRAARPEAAFETEPVLAADDWADTYSASVAQGDRLLHSAKSIDGAVLDQIARRLGTGVPDRPEGREGARALRLSLLVAAESSRAASASPERAAVLHSQAAEMWRSGTQLLDHLNGGR